jgi:hypothetical protein
MPDQAGLPLRQPDQQARIVAIPMRCVRCSSRTECRPGDIKVIRTTRRNRCKFYCLWCNNTVVQMISNTDADNLQADGATVLVLLEGAQ